jgi:hypothetical protein
MNGGYFSRATGSLVKTDCKGLELGWHGGSLTIAAKISHCLDREHLPIAQTRIIAEDGLLPKSAFVVWQKASISSNLFRLKQPLRVSDPPA